MFFQKGRKSEKNLEEILKTWKKFRQPVKKISKNHLATL